VGDEMRTQENAEKRFEAMMSLHGDDDYKTMAKRLRKFQQNSDKYTVSGVTLPNYLWVAKKGGGVSTRVNALAEYLYAAKLFEFSGSIKFFEFTLGYVAPNEAFSELTRLNNVILEIAGRHRYFRGIACINIDEWMQRTNELHFSTLLDYLAVKNEKIMTIFYVHTSSRRIIEGIESSISSHLRFETIRLKFPSVFVLLEIVENKYIMRHGFSFTDDAKRLLLESIKEISIGKHFYGYVTIGQLANDIMYSMLTSNIKSNQISADALSGFTKDSAYVKRIKAFVGVPNVIGFGAMEEHAK
jgi:hypothetical protein